MASSEKFRSRMRVEREAAGLSLRQLADACATQGHPLHLTTLSKVETGDRKLTYDDAVVIAHLLGFRVGLDDPPKVDVAAIRRTADAVGELSDELRAMGERLLVTEAMLDGFADNQGADDGPF